MAARRPLRADARRNHERIVAAAHEAFAAHGAGASLEEIARRAGVGSATLHRHFPSRWSLLDAVFHDRVEALCAKAHRYARESEPGTALFSWLRDFNTYAATSRGLVASLVHDGRDPGPVRQKDGCITMITAAAGELLRRAQQSGAARPGLRVEDLLALVSTISLATEHQADDEQARRLLDIAIDGVRAEHRER
ncbi:TetR/AcrR family transcriptional regulator [Streptomyces sp. B3I7]|uniref:TetR/AcrR family transcriptional regulator n=1 Tax=Streptomyces sp. B3I7 TaxID=3042269 RepID=UPI0027D8BB1E|nr:TetR/AcrR family transcriptional regulator [Streptomyces sp. B3I7]